MSIIFQGKHTSDSGAHACLSLGSLMAVYDDKHAVGKTLDYLHKWLESDMDKGNTNRSN